MKKPGQKVLLFAAPLGIIVVLTVLFGLSGGNSGLENYKAELRAKGEKIDLSDLGYPLKSEETGSLESFTNALKAIVDAVNSPSQLDIMRFVGPGKAQVSWAAKDVQFLSADGRTTGTLTWPEYHSRLEAASLSLSQTREALQTPARYLVTNLSDYMNGARNPFVQKRKAAQWLRGDAMGALHARERARALEDVHALVQLAQLHRDEPMLVNQMIRIAVGGVGLSVTWEMIQTDGWSEDELAAMQKDWEGLDLIEALEMGIVGDRALSGMTIDELRLGNKERIKDFFEMAFKAGSFREDLMNAVFFYFWQRNSEDDELLMLHCQQERLDSLRKLRRKEPWNTVQKELTAQRHALGAKADGINKYRYWFTFLSLPNIEKAGRSAVRNETLRRLTVTAIALKRFHIRHGKFPAELKELAPDLLSELLIDPMSGKPFHYRLNLDGTFTLYSTGEDGKDDNGDATSASPVKQDDLWTGRDAVWPVPVWESKIP